MLFSSSECIIWLTVFTAESVAIVTVNLLAIILFIKNRNLRTRSMYLVISLTVADMLVGVLSGGYATFARLLGCRLIKANLSQEVFFIIADFFSFLPSCLSDKHCCDFCRAISRYVSCIQASAHQELGLRGSNCCCLGFDCYCSSHLEGRVALFLWISRLHNRILLSFVFNCYICFLHFHSV